jgi:hypothetical protein
MDWTRITLIPKAFDFIDGVAYAEWLLSHSITPEVGEVYIIRLKAEDFVWMKVGDGKTALIDLPHMIIQ